MKERDEIRKNDNFKATDIYLRNFTVILMLKIVSDIYMENSRWMASFAFFFLNRQGHVTRSCKSLLTCSKPNDNLKSLQVY